MTTPTRRADAPAWVLAFLAAVLAVVLGALTAGPASALTASAAENRVGAFTTAATVLVGPSTNITAGQRLGNDAPQAQIVVATGVAANTGSAWTRVGRWMSPTERAAMEEAGSIQWNTSGVHRVANPASPTTYRGAPRGDVYVEYDVPSSVLRPHSEGTSIIYGPESLQARLPGRAQPGDVPFRNLVEPR